MSIPPPNSSAPATRCILLPFGGCHERQVGIARYAREAGWALEVRGNLPAETRAGWAREWGVDAIVSHAQAGDDRLHQLLRSAGVPVVDLGRQPLENLAGRVVCDDHAIGREGAQHLIGLGFRQVAFLPLHEDSEIATARLQGFTDKARAAGATVHQLSALRSGRDAGWHESDRKLLAEAILNIPLPCGIMAADDAAALKLLEAAGRAGLHVPRDLAVLGVDDTDLAGELAPIPLSSVEAGRRRIGYEAAALLDRIFRGAPAGTTLTVSPRGVHSRQSTDVLAVGNPDVAEAIRYIREHFRRPIAVRDVVAHAQLSQRRLFDLFRQNVGHTIAEEIRRRRLEWAQRLLREGDLKIHAIARDSGFGSASRMSIVFTRVLGMTPQAYREASQESAHG